MDRNGKMSSSSRRQSVIQDNYININNYNLSKETDRKASFIENGYSNNNISIEDLALVGFYFYKKPDTVKCAFCYVIIENFQNGDLAIDEHLKFSPNCPLLAKRRSTGNIPIDERIFRQRIPSISSFDDCGSKKSKKTRDYEYPQYRLPQVRLKSFETWPIGIKQKPIDLAAAGFFYSGQSDLVICFSCGLYLNQWEISDNPWIEHKKWLTKECNYLNLNQDILNEEERKYNEFKKLAVTEAEIKTLHIDETVKRNVEANHKETDLENICKICLERRSQIIFLPCRHVAVCGSCVFGIDDKCPICRAEIKEKFNVIFP